MISNQGGPRWKCVACIKWNALCKITVSPHIHPDAQVYLAAFLQCDLANLTFYNISTLNTIVVLVQIKENFYNPEKKLSNKLVVSIRLVEILLPGPQEESLGPTKALSTSK